MGHEIRCIVEVKRLVCLVGVVFAVVIMFQYFEFPYGDVISSLFSASNVQIPENGSYPLEVSSPIPKILGNITRIGSSNGTRPSDVLVKGNRTTFKGHDVGVEKEFEPTMNGESGGNGVSGNKVEENDSFVSAKARESGSDSSTDDSNHSMLRGKSSDAPSISLGFNTSTPARNASNSVHNFEELGASHRDLVPLANNSSVIDVSRKKGSKKSKRKVVSISEMHDILVRNRASFRSMKPLWSSPADQELLEAKSQIENASVIENDHSLDPSLFHNVSMFKRSYELMEKTLKVYVYQEGDKPIFNEPKAVLKGIYASEGWFMMQMKASKGFLTKNPKQAHLFYIPYSSKILRFTISPNSHDRENVVPFLKNYLDMITGRYNFWNRTGGADHFLVACHDWGAAETRQYMGTCIRALCNTDVKKEGFELGKDVSLPETNVRYPENPSRELGGKPPSKRLVLAFFAGKMHGSLRPILLRHWENKDPDMKIFGMLPKTIDDRNYIQYMKNSKYCICAKGSEVNSPRVVEAIFYECVPVIISDNFVPPFFEVFDWETFAVFVQEKDIPNLKKILLSISKTRYLVMQKRVKQVQKHFLWHVKPVKYDIFHMILHSIWYSRVFRVNPR